MTGPRDRGAVTGRAITSAVGLRLGGGSVFVAVLLVVVVLLIPAVRGAPF
jgi:hypothetical protein